jgi:hypothetical protein
LILACGCETRTPVVQPGDRPTHARARRIIARRHYNKPNSKRATNATANEAIERAAAER